MGQNMSTASSSPIVLIGAARSGTKFARSILAASKDISAIDYDVNYIWRYGNEHIEHDELDPASATPKICAHIDRQLHRLAKIGPSDHIALVEKTVSNTLRVPFIEAVFPNARYVHIVRDGRAVTESAMRLWQAPPDTGSLLKKLRQIPLSSAGYVMWFGYNFVKGLVTGRGGGQVWGPRYKGIMSDIEIERPLVEICAQQWQRSVESATSSLAKIDPQRVFTLRYNDLVSNEDAIKDLIHFANLSDEEAILDHYRATVRTDNDEKWRKRMNQEDVAKMMGIIAPTLKKLDFATSGGEMMGQ